MTACRGLRTVVLAAALGLAVAACGVPLDDDPQAITRTTIAPATTQMVTTPGPDAVDVQVYFLNDEQGLQALSYPVDPDEASLAGALSFVLQGVPENAPADPPLHTTIPPETRLRGAQVVDGVATINLSSDIVDAIRGDSQKQAFAQLVFTAMNFDPDGITGVTFLIDGAPQDAPTDDNNLLLITTDNYQPPLNPK